MEDIMIVQSKFVKSFFVLKLKQIWVINKSYPQGTAAPFHYAPTLAGVLRTLCLMG